MYHQQTNKVCTQGQHHTHTNTRKYRLKIVTERNYTATEMERETHIHTDQTFTKEKNWKVGKRENCEAGQ